MQDVALLTGKHGVAYIPIAEARGITPLMIKICVLIFSILALAGLIIGLLLSIGSLGVVISSTI